jgi:predicted MarR family transcription regulator
MHLETRILKHITIINFITKTINKMAKFELIKTTDVNGEIWYNITKDGLHVNTSFTKKLEDAEKMLQELVNGKPSAPIVEIIKTIENGED